jgi:hypothetical protein
MGKTVEVGRSLGSEPRAHLEGTYSWFIAVGTEGCGVGFQMGIPGVLVVFWCRILREFDQFGVPWTKIIFLPSSSFLIILIQKISI